jgi:hypothetical protein
MGLAETVPRLGEDIFVLHKGVARVWAISPAKRATPIISNYTSLLSTDIIFLNFAI